MNTEQKCRICGCTNDDCSQCIRLTGRPCHWVEADLCSACQAAIDNSKTNADMNFFQQLFATGDVDITMRIMKKNEKLTINLMPGSNVSKLQPIIISGTPTELDEEFFKTIVPDVQDIKGIVSNIADVKKEAVNKAEKTRIKPESKPAKKKAEEKNKAKKKPAKPEVVETSLFGAPADVEKEDDSIK